MTLVIASEVIVGLLWSHFHMSYFEIYLKAENRPKVSNTQWHKTHKNKRDIRRQN